MVNYYVGVETSYTYLKGKPMHDSKSNRNSKHITNTSGKWNLMVIT